MKKYVIEGPITAEIKCPNCGEATYINFHENPDVCPHCDKWFKIWLDLKGKNFVFVVMPHTAPESKLTADNPPPGEKAE